jgi:enamine deaminase RidA (YjgF/YER057c/UK114 family)
MAGTLGVGPGGKAAGDAYEHGVAALERIRGRSRRSGATTADVVRTRMFVVDIERNQFEVGRAHPSGSAGAAESTMLSRSRWRRSSAASSTIALARIRAASGDPCRIRLGA